MPEMNEYTPGNFCWVELATTEQEAAKQFYTALFGWSANEVPIGPEGVNTMLQLRGRDAAALYALTDEQRSMGISPHWLAYVAVSSADETVLQVQSLGGIVIAQPFDVMDVGRMAVVQDPLGGTFALWEARSHRGAGVANEPRSFSWAELVTRDAQRAGEFYAGLFGWETEAQPAGTASYTTFQLNGRRVAGLLEMSGESGELAPHWIVYFAVRSVDEAVLQAQSLGGVLRIPPTDNPAVGRFASLEDPQGAVFSIVELQMPV
jgi:predicted enzyme related to lactoylglutathione lyase